VRTFVLIRDRDVSGVSGTGRVAEGVVFVGGKTVVYWLSDTPSINIYGSVEEMLRVHGHGGATHVEFLT